MTRALPRPTRRAMLAAAAAFAAAGVPACAARPREAPPAASPASGPDVFTFDGWAGPPLNVWTYRPEAAGPDAPVALIMHGQRRNAWDYRDQWIAPAEERGFIVAAPEFSTASFPGSRSYNLGGRRSEDGALVPRELWSYSAVDPVFEAVRARMGLSATGYAIYGHSAGSQFVHRFMLHVPQTRVRRAVTANAGWYQMPDFDLEQPFGLAGEGLDQDALRAWLARPMTVLLGTADIDELTPSLNRDPAAMVQGPNRLARGQAFFAAGRRQAERLETPFGWALAFAPGVAHDNSRMAPYAVDHLLG